MELSSLTGPELIFPSLPGSDGPTVLRAFAERIEAHGLVSSADDLYQRLWQREELGSTAIGSGVAIPHCKMEGFEAPRLAVGLSAKEVDFGAVDGQPVRVFFLLISPAEPPAEHLRALASISKWLKADRHVERILELSDAEEIYRLLAPPEGGGEESA